MLMALLYIVAALVVAGLVLYFVNGAPVDGTIKWLIKAVVVIFCVIWCLYWFFGMIGGMHFPAPIR